VIFRGKFRGISRKNDFLKLFPWKIPIIPNIFVGKIFRGIFPEIFPGKNVRKIGPWSNVPEIRRPGLPYGIFAYQKSQFWKLWKKKLVYFTAIWYIFWWFCYIFSSFGTLYRYKSGNPAVNLNKPLQIFAFTYLGTFTSPNVTGWHSLNQSQHHLSMKIRHTLYIRT
jgi:hypothetical protein